MTTLWKLIKRNLNEKIFKTKTAIAVSEEGKDDGKYDRECDPEINTRRAGRTDSCYTSYDDESCYERSTRCVTTSTYDGTASDFYIGVDAQTASTIYLPTAVRDGKIIIIKAEMKPPIGKRIITVATLDDSLIDGYGELVLQVSRESRTLLYSGGHWHVIGK